MTTKRNATLKRALTLTLPIVAGGLLAACAHQVAVQTPYGSAGVSLLHTVLIRLLSVLAGTVLGALVGGFLSDRARRFRALVMVTLLALVVLFGITVSNAFAFFGTGFIAGISVWLYFRNPDDSRGEDFEPVFGDAHPATRADMVRAGYLAASESPNGVPHSPIGIPLGSFTEAKIGESGDLL